MLYRMPERSPQAQPMAGGGGGGGGGREQCLGGMACNPTI